MLQLDVPDAQITDLNLLVSLGIYGATPEAVAGYLLTRALDDLQRSGLGPGLRTLAPAPPAP